MMGKHGKLGCAVFLCLTLWLASAWRCCLARSSMAKQDEDAWPQAAAWISVPSEFQHVPTHGKVMKGQHSGHQSYLMDPDSAIGHWLKTLFLAVATAVPRAEFRKSKGEAQDATVFGTFPMQRLSAPGRSQPTCPWSNFVLVRPRLFSCRCLFFLGGAAIFIQTL